MTRKYGPSNYESRPSETRSRIITPPTPDNKGVMALEVWLARDLMAEQVDRALDQDELSPDAMFGLARRLADLRSNSSNALAIKDLVLLRRELISYACDRYKDVADDFIRTNKIAGHRVIISIDDRDWLIGFVRHYIDKLTILGDHAEIMDHYALGCLNDILYITSEYLDQSARSSDK